MSTGWQSMFRRNAGEAIMPPVFSPFANESRSPKNAYLKKNNAAKSGMARAKICIFASYEHFPAC
jgi:hypothetical protein